MNQPIAPRSSRRRVVIVGGGIAGLGAALRLSESGASVDLFEATQHLGGACHGVEVPQPDGTTRRVDAGVCDFNRTTFTELDRLLAELGAPLTPVCQDASFRRPDGTWVWSSTEAGPAVAAGVAPAFLGELERFRLEVATVDDPAVRAGDWLTSRGYSEAFQTLCFAPRAMGCFPTPCGSVASLPLRSLVRFWGMHGIVGPGAARRVCVTGGMHRYIGALRARLELNGVRVHLGEPVERVWRSDHGVRLRSASGTLEADDVVVATWPHVALRVLADPSPGEVRVLSACRTQPGRVVVHHDPRLMPDDPARWGAYNYVVPDRTSTEPTITFWPARLARLRELGSPVLVTLDPHIEPRDVVHEVTLIHPVFGRDDDVGRRLDALQGERRTWFCGSWVAEPYLHETALRSGYAVARRIGAVSADGVL